MKKQMLMIVIMMMLFGAGGCSEEFASSEPTCYGNEFSFLLVATDMVEPIVVGGHKNTSNNFFDKRCMSMEQSIGATVTYNYNNLSSPYQIGSIPTNPTDWMKWHVMNVKLGKHLSR